jgi:hypothetical protein
VKLSPGQQAYVDQCEAEIREELPATLALFGKQPLARALAETVVDDCLSDERTVIGRLLAWREFLAT